jgi:tetratricopeptide (TPR) repeat protein
MATRAVRLLVLLFAIGLTATRAHAQPAAGNADSPEALLNLARLDADAGRLDRAISNYERSIAIIDGPRPPGVNGTTAAQWKAFAPIAKLNLGILYAAKGVDFFQANDLRQAISLFRTSLVWNPYSRDIRYNLCQAMYIQASKLREQGRPAGELSAIYADIVAEAAKVREADPANPNLGLILGYSHRNLGDETNAAAVFAENAALPFEVGDVRMDIGTAETRISGVVKNLKMKEGEAVRLRFTLLDLNGAAITAGVADIAAASINQGTTFVTAVKTTGDVAGWRYEIVR